ncbi:MAG TPA: hypothetical protein VK154_14570 [Chitinophagales bacterium]|nr:hypothetical protein [Chitinophagales bacterium]
MKSAKTPVALCFLLFAIVGFNACKDKEKPATDTAPVNVTGEGYSDSSSSSVKVFTDNGKVCIQQSNTYYELVDAYEGTTRLPLLLKIRKTELCYADSTNKKKVYEISAKSVMDTKAVAWQAQFVATQMEFKDNSVLATYEGGEGEEDYLQRFSLLDGKPVFSSSYGEVKVGIPNVKDKRFIGYTSKRAVSNPLKDVEQENLLGVIRFGSSTEAIGALRVSLKRSKVADKIPAYTPDMVLVAANENTTVIEDGKSVILMKTDEHYKKADVKDFSVKLTYYYGDDNEATEIIVPVADDKFNLAGAKYDKEIFDIQVLKN